MATLQFSVSLDGPSRVLRDWNGNGRSAWTNVRRWARKHGAAGAWLANGSFRLVFVEAGKLRQKTWPHAVPTRESVAALCG